MALTDKMHPILITLDVEEVLVMCTVIETFRMTCGTCDMRMPREVKMRIEGILKKMIRELEYQVEGE